MGKRGNGEGTLIVRNGSFRCQIVVAGKRRSVTAKSKAELRRKVRDLQSNADKGILPPPRSITVERHLNEWLENIIKPSRRPRTYQGYKQLTRCYILPELGAIRLVDLQPGHLQKLYGQMQDKGLSANTVQRVHNVLRRSLRHALEAGLVPRNVATAAHRPTAKRRDMTVLSREQAKALIAAAKGTRHAALITLALYTGMRIGELLGLRWRDVDLDRAALSVTQQLGVDGAFSEPKTGAGRRRINLSPAEVEQLRVQKVAQEDTKLLIGSEWQEHDLVFCTHSGRSLGYRNVVRDFKGLLQRAGLPDMRFHDLRHTAATLMLLGDVPVKVVSERLGHADIRITLDTYSHVLPTMGKEAAAKMHQLLT